MSLPLFYHRNISPIYHSVVHHIFGTYFSCRFSPTCSVYSHIAYTRYGIIQGTFLTFKRIIRCQPFSKGGYDPVPDKI